MARKWKVERMVDGKWHMYGVYTDKFINQMAAAIQDLVNAGFEVYKTIRIVEVDPDG